MLYSNKHVYVCAYIPKHQKSTHCVITECIQSIPSTYIIPRGSHCHRTYPYDRGGQGSRNGASRGIGILIVEAGRAAGTVLVGV